MAKVNCWTFKNCGRQFGGAKAAELGICPAASARATHGINGGISGGRACWAIAGTLCGGKVQGSYATKLANCLNCDFYKLVVAEEGKNLVSVTEIIKRSAV